MFTPQEKRVVYGITFAVAVRMLGLFLLLPVLSPYVSSMEGATPLLTGLAIGAYGFTQALLQIPFGYLSDRYRRKPVIVFGFLLYIAGSILGGLANHVYTMILARLIQGSGAISSATVALSADLIREEVRTRAFAFVGSSIGVVFALSIILAPPLAGKFGVPFIFFLTALLSTLSLLYVVLFIPEPRRRKENLHFFATLVSILKNREMFSINFSVGILHAIMVFIFTVFPIFFIREHDFPKAHHWKVYLPIILVSMILMVPAIVIGEKKRRLKEIILAGSLLVVIGLAISHFHSSFKVLLVSLLLFFIGFHFLEPTLPSLLTRLSGEERRGIAVGVYNTSQFTGAFMGGLLGGLALKAGYSYILLLILLISLLWIGVIWAFVPSLRERV